MQIKIVVKKVQGIFQILLFQLIFTDFSQLKNL